MTSPHSPATPDPHARYDSVLLPFIRAQTEEEATACLESLLTAHAAPIIRRILRRELHLSAARDDHHHQHAEDIYGEVILHLTERLCRLRPDPRGGITGKARRKAHKEPRGIPDFGGYVAIAAYNAVYEFLHTLYPQRRRLKDKLRYLLKRHPALGLWRNAAGLFVAGFEEWLKQDAVKALSAARLKRLVEDSSAAAGGEILHATWREMPLVEMVIRLFDLAEQPVAFNALVSIVAELRGVEDMPGKHGESIKEIEQRRDAEQRRSDAEQSATEHLDRREMLRRVWQEIIQLPFNQRTAYLLHFRESRGHADITTFLFTRTASIEQIAQALEMSLEELSELWGSLPLDDKTIAARLSAMPEQVTSLRKCAHARLKRRLGIIKMIATAVAGWSYSTVFHMFR
ncbi:MAG: hypothetical protein MSG64_10265 [Pyrinomonadaceae bacterium MAG19_C2-C3]|nr:hypothetical protein [Pyrinomonadaceae bacterium MAG19_C2-C3]